MLKVRIIPTSVEPQPDAGAADDPGMARASLFLESPWKLRGSYPVADPGDDALSDMYQSGEDEPAILVMREGSARVFLMRRPDGGIARPETVDIQIDSHTAFGDGKHPTTELCIDILGRHLAGIPSDTRNKLSMVDVGTGSGILAIMALKLGIGRVDALDLSPDAARCARGNARLNACDMRVDLCDVAEFDTGMAYDIVVANMVTDVITRRIEDLARLMRDGGTMIASGISTGSAAVAADCFARHGYESREMLYWRGWTGFLLERRVGRDRGGR